MICIKNILISLERNNRKENKEIDKSKIIELNLRWIIAILIAIIILIASYNVWGKSSPLENLISISSGLISIVLGVFAIIYSMSESIKNNNKENKINDLLYDDKNNVNNLNDITLGIQKIVDGTRIEISYIRKSIEEGYKSFDYAELYKVNNESQTLD